MIFCIFIFLNRTGAEIGYKLDKKCEKINFYY